MNDTPSITVVKGDIEKAIEYKTRLNAALQAVCETMTEAKRDGIDLAFMLQPDAMGRTFVAQLKATKELV